MKHLFQWMVVACLGTATAMAAPQQSSASVDVGHYGQELAVRYGGDAGLSSTDARAVAVMEGGRVYAGSTHGLDVLVGDVWQPVDDMDGQEILALAASGDTLYVAVPMQVLQIVDGNVSPLIEHLPARPLNLAVDGETLWISTAAGLFSFSAAGLERADTLYKMLGHNPRVNDVAAHQGHVAAAAPEGLFERTEENDWTQVEPWEGEKRWAPYDVRAVAYDPQSRLWFACPQGVGRREASGEWSLFTGAEGLPYNDFTCMTADPGGAVWFGTFFGAVRYHGDHWAYREGKRWLPGDEVRDVAVAPSGDAWFATAKGVGCILRKPMTLAEKAAFYEDEIDKYHRRTPYGYVAGVELVKPNDTSETIQHDTDNDGQYTGLYGGAECLAYGATGDPRAKERATKAFEALAFLSEVTQGGSNPAPRGFIARTILPTDGPDPNEHNSPERDREKQKGDALWKVIIPRWPTSEDGTWYWKTDTSSDELDGHFFLYGLYYDLVAETDAEKARARDVVSRVADHLIEHDYRLVDHDGKPTRWARFSPKDLNEDPDFWAERGLNSLSILTYLSVAYHVTGDQKYRDAYEDLAWNHYYALNGMVMPKLQAGPGSFVQFDDKMAFMNYYHLLQYETDPVLLRMYQNSIYYYWQIVKYEMNPFFNFVYASLCLDQKMHTQWGDTALSPTGPWLEQSVDTLKRFPYDLVNWKHTNSKRIDIIPLPDHVREPGENEGTGYRTNGYVIPIDERQSITWSEDVWRLDTGGNPKWLDEGSPYLLAYYVGLYHGFIK